MHVFLLFLIASLGEQSPQLDPAKVEFFESKIRPVLIAKCYSCHSASSKSLEGELLLDSRAGWQKGGAGGPVIKPGDPKQSRLLQAMRHADPDFKMPPKEKLPDTVLADFERWIADGAVDPRDGISQTESKADRHQREAKERWSFHKPVDPPLPAVKQSKWIKTGVDHFILAKLEAADLVPMPDADRRHWLRRVTYDLTGLPPSLIEVNNYLQDQSPDADAKVVDRLLASPHYGERWGRHWMDVIRYADTAGDNSDFPIPQMYRYRNWIIDAFNRDLPYDEFIRQQLAGDLLPSANAQDHQSKLIATGYISNARRFGSRVDDYPTHLTIEDSIDNVGRAFLGLSLNCARCHDHKFDPISTEDYYALYGYFDSTRYPWPGIELDQRQRDFVPLADAETVERLNADRAARLAPLQQEVKRLEKLRSEAKDDAPKDLNKKLEQAKQALERENKRPLPYPTAYAVTEKQKATNARVQFKGDPTKTGNEVPRRFLTALGGQQLSPTDSSSGRLQLANCIADPNNPLTARVMVNRIWQHHFGRGIVPTPNDFGKQGRPASHPELLDWLAHRFVESKWSIKRMHRLIVHSHTYRLAVFDDAEKLARDPNNDLLAGYRRRRLDAESIRDTLLLHADMLDRSAGGEHPFPPMSEWKFTQHNPFKAEYPTHRRSVYLMTQRIQREPFLAIFDGADPNASTALRTSSTTPLQSLYFLNNPQVHELATKMAQRFHRLANDNPARIQLTYQHLFARLPTEPELSAGLEFLQQGASDPQTAWASYARALLRTNEFVYLD